MNIITKVLPRNHRLFLAGDLHEGTILTHDHGVQQLIKLLKDDDESYLVLMGDLAEAITIDDKRYDGDTISPDNPLPLQQYQRLVDLLWPVRKQILLCLEGNHDYKISQRFGNCVKDIFCKQLEIDYGTFSSKLIVKDKKKKLMYKAFLIHGVKGINSTADDPIRREANMQLQLKSRLKRKFGDCALMAVGHTHKLIVAPPTKELYLTDEDEKIRQEYTQSIQTAKYIHPDHRWYVNTGSFMKLFARGASGYAERFGLDPVELGFPIVHVEDGIITDIKKVIFD